MKWFYSLDNKTKKNAFFSTSNPEKFLRFLFDKILVYFSEMKALYYP